MNFFCRAAELDEYAKDQELKEDTLIRADADRALREAIETFSV